MKIARFSAGGDPQFGIVDDDELVVLSGDPMFHGYETTGERVKLSDVRLLAPVIPRSKVVCIGMNYAAHVQSMAYEVPENPELRIDTTVMTPQAAAEFVVEHLRSTGLFDPFPRGGDA